MRWVNRVVALCFVASCWGLWPQTESFPGSAAEFPRLMLIIIAVLSALMFVRSFVPVFEAIGSAEGSAKPTRMIRPVLVFSATVLAVICVKFVGFFPAVAGLGLALIAILGVRAPKVYIASYLGLMAFVFLLFQLLLKVPLNSAKLWG